LLIGTNCDESRQEAGVCCQEDSGSHPGSADYRG
jgi:hypothetical protein